MLVDREGETIEFFFAENIRQWLMLLAPSDEMLEMLFFRFGKRVLWVSEYPGSVSFEYRSEQELFFGARDSPLSKAESDSWHKT